MAASQCMKASFTQKSGVARSQRASAKVVCALPTFKQAATAFGTAAATLALTLSANAATVKLGTDNGGLVFEPSTVTIAKGESVTWVNNAGYPHNIVFDEDAVPSGVNAESLGHEDYLNAPGETHTTKFDTAGEYTYYCEPHQGAGMQGKVIVN